MGTRALERMLEVSEMAQVRFSTHDLLPSSRFPMARRRNNDHACEDDADAHDRPRTTST